MHIWARLWRINQYTARSLSSSLCLCSDGSRLSCCDVDHSAPQIPPLCHSGCFTNVCPRPFLYVSLSQLLAGLPLPLFPAVISWMVVFSSLLCLMMWPKCFIFLFIICFTSMSFVLNCSKIQALVLCLPPWYSQQSPVCPHFKCLYIFLVTFFEYAHDSHPYVATAKAVALAMRSLRLDLADCLAFPNCCHNLFSIVLLAMHSLRLTSGMHATHICVDKGSWPG